MKQTIEELWHGNIIPQEDSRTNSPEMKELLSYMARHHEELEKSFTDEQKEIFILELQKLLKEGPQHAKTYGAGKYKTLPNTVGGIETVHPKSVSNEMQKLVFWYNSLKRVTFENIVDFHYRFETIHPFQDGNGGVGRLIAFKQCLENNLIPFYIDDTNKWLYYRGLKEWNNERNYLIETCRFGQDQYEKLMDYFGIKYI